MHSDAVPVELIGLGWERIQCHLRFRAAPDNRLAPETIRLQDDAGEQVRPAHASVMDGHVVVRVNVMQGPDRRPLHPGRWRLVAAPPNAAGPVPLVVCDPTAGGDAGARARFPIGGLEYVAEAVVAADAALAIVVEVNRLAREAGPLPRPAAWLKGRLRWAIRPVRRRAFRLVFRVARAARPRNGRRILFTSDSNDRLAGNLKLVHDRMKARGLDRRHELRTLFSSPGANGRSIRNRLLLPVHLARADVVVLDDFHPLVYQLEFDPDVKVVQLWHASGAFKTVGYSRVGRPGAPSPFGRAHKNYTHAIVSSRFEVPHYAEAFGIPESRVHPTGIPRMDRFFDSARRAANREATLGGFPAARGRMTILFAPTFRGHGARGARYDVELLDYAALHRLCVEKDAVVIFRMHPFVRAPLRIPDALRDRLLEASGAGIDVNDLLPAVDLLITDYSSIVFEFAALGRPMLFFAYDLDTYLFGRGFYVPYQEFVPGRIVRTFPELLEAIRHDAYEAHKVVSFAARHLDHLDGGSTDRVIDLIVAG